MRSSGRRASLVRGDPQIWIDVSQATRLPTAAWGSDELAPAGRAPGRDKCVTQLNSRTRSARETRAPVLSLCPGPERQPRHVRKRAMEGVAIDRITNAIEPLVHPDNVFAHR